MIRYQLGGRIVYSMGFPQPDVFDGIEDPHTEGSSYLFERRMERLRAFGHAGMNVPNPPANPRLVLQMALRS